MENFARYLYMCRLNFLRLTLLQKLVIRKLESNLNLCRLVIYVGHSQQMINQVYLYVGILFFPFDVVVFIVNFPLGY